jgi:hypothetical protein
MPAAGSNGDSNLEWWENERASWRESFAQAVDGVIAEETAKQ